LKSDICDGVFEKETPMKKYVVKSCIVDGMNLRVTKYKGERKYRFIVRNISAKVQWNLAPDQQTERKIEGKALAVAAFQKMRTMILTMAAATAHVPTVMELVRGFKNGTQEDRGWIETRRHELKKSTLEGYQRTFDYFENDFGRRRIDSIKGHEVLDWLIAFLNSGAAFSTVKNHKNHVSNLFRYAIMREYLDVNPVSRFKLRKPPVMGLDKADLKGALEQVGQHRYLETPPHPFSEAERDRFEAVVNEHFPHYYAMVVTAFRCGLRIGELSALPWYCVDYEEKLIKIRLNYTHYELSDAKHSHKRDIPMTDDLIPVLREQELYVKNMALKMGRKIEVVFPNQNGGLLDTNNLPRNFLNDACVKAEIERRTMHNLRDTYASLRLSKGHPIEEVAKHLGHHDPQVTYKHYYQYIRSASLYDPNDISPGAEAPEPEAPAENKKRAERVDARSAPKPHLRLVINQ
jgi:integrase